MQKLAAPKPHEPRSTMRVLVYFPKFSIHFIRFAAKIAKPAAPLAVNGT
jgi:hypothetical protein